MLINRVKDYRKGANLTQEGLATMTGVSRQTIISIEKNKFVPGLDVAIRISESLKTPINKLFYLGKLHVKKITIINIQMTCIFCFY